MATTSGTENPGLTEPDIAAGRESGGPRVEVVLRDDPWSFQFFQAVRLLERYGDGRYPVGGFADPDREAVRFTTHPAMEFPASQIAKLSWTPGKLPMLAVNFLGLMGHSGVLPLPYCDYINERLRARDSVLQSFFDIFNHRMISLFYQAWEKYRFAVTYERDRADRLTLYLRDFIGIGTKGLQERQKVRDESLIFYTGLLSLQPRSACALKSLLQDYFEISVEIDQFVGAWYSLETRDQCQVGEEHVFSEQLGLGAVAGDEMWDIQSRARLILGPMSMGRYLEFLPGGSAYQTLRSILHFFSNREITFEAQLLLVREDVPGIELGAGDGDGVRLSWTTWIKNAPLTRDPGDTVLEIN